ncbi:hypothetical protein DMA11_20860 [Marinilabiliaceae bacterium JC017]|nr:hypothetical protein DMA11_20860 [Marinilabiliaceae bacterium JC017]
MGYKHFSVSVIIQALLLAVTPILFALSLKYEYLIVTRYSLVVAYCLQVAGIIRTVRKSNREVARFIESFRFGDTTIHFHNQDKDKSFQDLFVAFNKVVSAFRQLKVDKEKEYQFFENALQNMGVAILVINEKDHICMQNAALRQLFAIEYLYRLEKLNQFKPGLVEQLKHLKAEKQQLIEVVVSGRVLQVAVRAVLMQQDGQRLKLFAFQDIQGEIEQKELEAWQKLIRVLTHEVMNSLSPVNLLSAGLKRRFEQTESEDGSIQLNDQDRQETIEALEAINTRSKGLTRFVESYRSLAGLHSVNMDTCDVETLLSRVVMLMQDNLRQRNIDCKIINPTRPLSYELDDRLIEQVLINLVKNSMEAIDHEAGEIKISAVEERGRLVIGVKDNGKGIPREELDKVCVPFYTTRRHGNGIGLALSRQVMRLHGGELKIFSTQGEGTKVELAFG